MREAETAFERLRVLTKFIRWKSQSMCHLSKR